ncbi:MAG: hypothetical protein Q9214_007158, partial [Letrouitia sp. 1 TL-2023]
IEEETIADYWFKSFEDVCYQMEHTLLEAMKAHETWLGGRMEMVEVRMERVLTRLGAAELTYLMRRPNHPRHRSKTE